MSIRDIQGGVTIDILVVPRASRERFGPVHGDRIKVSVTSPPVDGAANQAIVKLIAKRLGVANAAVKVLTGLSSRRKRVQVMGVLPDTVGEMVQ